MNRNVLHVIFYLLLIAVLRAAMAVTRVFGERWLIKRPLQLYLAEVSVDGPLEEQLRAMESIARYKLWGRKPLCSSLDELLSRPDWFDERSHQAPVGQPAVLRDSEPSVVVFDGFYTDPMAVRQMALQGRFFEYFRNWRMSQDGEDRQGATLLVGDDIRRAFERICRVRIEDQDEHWANKDGNGVFHYKTREPFSLSSSIHTHQTIDVRYGYNAIVYLNPPGTYPPNTGISIWRDRQTGKCVLGNKAFRIGLHRFDLMFRAENRFNRVVAIRSDVWHMGESGFGKTPETARLFQTFFFEIKGRYETVVPETVNPSVRVE